MELTNRILEIIEKSGLTASEFADKIEVQRSAISHLTSGRNKASLEFLLKIKNAFPEIDTDWLLFGIEKETVLEEKIFEKENIKTSEDFRPTLFDEHDFEVEKPKTEEVVEIRQMQKNVQSKKISRVLIFFDDGSFEDYEK